MEHTVFAVLTDEELIRYAETIEHKSALEVELLLRFRNRVDNNQRDGEMNG